MKPVIYAAAAILLLAACAPTKLSRVDEEDVSCLLADLAAFSTAQKADQGVQSPLTLALAQSALYRMGRLQGRHGDDDWPEVISKLDPAVMKVKIYDKIQACSQSADFRNLMSNPKLKAALQRMGDPPGVR
ncbi:hypothetical protein BH11PSE1_BH11PSE1_08290 [soil metagenome]